MLTLRPTKMLAQRVGLDLQLEPVSIELPHCDWCAHTFSAQRYRYMLLTNTHSFLSVVTIGAGITSEDAFIRAALHAIGEYLAGSGPRFAFERLIGPYTSEVRFAQIPDRRILGTINELIFQATLEIVEGGLSPHETSEKLNEVPLSALWNRGDTIAAGPTFDRMPARLDGQV